MNAGFDLREVADAAARAAIEIFEAREKALGMRHRGMKAIAAAVAKTTRLPEPSPTTIRLWVRTKRFPLDRDPIGMFVDQWALERWLKNVKTGGR